MKWSKIITRSEDVGHAVDRLAEALNLTDDQAKAIVHQSVGSLVKSNRAKLDKQIAFLEKQIAENKLDVLETAPGCECGDPETDRAAHPGPDKSAGHCGTLR